MYFITKLLLHENDHLKLDISKLEIADATSKSPLKINFLDVTLDGI
jgi:hypothetical protein